jgi:hypothetical protein
MPTYTNVSLTEPSSIIIDVLTDLVSDLSYNDRAHVAIYADRLMNIFEQIDLYADIFQPLKYANEEAIERVLIDIRKIDKDYTQTYSSPTHTLYLSSMMGDPSKCAINVDGTPHQFCISCGTNVLSIELYKYHGDDYRLIIGTSSVRPILETLYEILDNYRLKYTTTKYT